jgi:hypothetical protein
MTSSGLFDDASRELNANPSADRPTTANDRVEFCATLPVRSTSIHPALDDPIVASVAPSTAGLSFHVTVDSLHVVDETATMLAELLDELVT